MVDEMAEGHEDSLLAAEYALGLLTRDESRSFERRLGAEPSLRALYASWTEDFAAMADAIPEVAAPRRVWRSIEGRLFGEEKRSLGSRFALWPLLGGAVVAALLFVVVGTDGLFDRAADPTLVAELASEETDVRLVAGYVEDERTLHVTTLAGTVPDGRVLELWLIAGEAAPVSLGLLPNEGTAVLEVSDSVIAALEGGTLAVSEEPPGGAPDGAPTGQILALGPVNRT